MMKRLGISLEVTKKGKHKDMYLFHGKYTREEKKKMEELNDDIYKTFCTVVAEQRGIDKKKIEKLATGEIFPARRAHELELIDNISDWEGVVEEMYAATSVKRGRIIYIRPRPSFIRRIVGGLVNTIADEAYERMLHSSLFRTNL